MAVFVSFNGGHNYFKFQSYGTVTHKINVHKLLNSFLAVMKRTSSKENLVVVLVLKRRL